ncbi:MAG: chemotaxis protein CheD [Methylococcales bacterium]|nr:chemotaxis protein CheD [Methylococcales bacterium]
MKTPDFVLDIFLQPGDFYFGDRETRVRTLLGSCVAFTVWHPKLLIGGMCHYLLPENKQLNRNIELDGRYANEALLLFLHEINNAGTRPADYEVKMFGGGNQFPGHVTDSKINISDKNIQIGKSLLVQHGFKLKSEHVGGNGHRNVMLDIWSGHVWMQHVHTKNSE